MAQTCIALGRDDCSLVQMVRVAKVKAAAKPKAATKVAKVVAEDSLVAICEEEPVADDKAATEEPPKKRGRQSAKFAGDGAVPAAKRRGRSKAAVSTAEQPSGSGEALQSQCCDGAPMLEEQNSLYDLKSAAKAEELSQIDQPTASSSVCSHGDADRLATMLEESDSDGDDDTDPKETGDSVAKAKLHTLADKLSESATKRSRSTVDLETVAERMRARRFPTLSDTAWREMVDENGVRLKDWVIECCAANRSFKKKFHFAFS